MDLKSILEVRLYFGDGVNNWVGCEEERAIEEI